MIDKKTCVCCGEEKSSLKFYSQRNKLINEKFGLCKECAKDYVKVDTDFDTLHAVLRFLDLPFILERWTGVTQTDNGDNLGNYLRQISSLRGWKGMTYKDSTRLDVGEIQDTQDLLAKTDKSYQENIKFWANRNYTPEEFDFLNEVYEELCQDRKPNSFTVKNTYKNVARTQLQINKALEAGNGQEYDRLIKSLSKLMEDGNIKPTQTAGENSSVASWGEWVRKIEEQRPVLAPTAEFEDVDGIEKYIKKFFTKHFNRVFGLDNSPVSDDLGDEFNIDKIREEAMETSEEEGVDIGD